MSDDIELHKYACEAREIASRSLDQRRMYLREVEARRGKVAAEKLRAALKELWDARDAAKVAV